MEIIILILLSIVIVCLIVLLMQNKSKESVSSNSDSLILQKNFEYLLKQVQDVQKNQATSKVSLNQMEEYLYRMNMVMTNTKLRGNWGEYQLDMLLSVYCGQNPSIYSMQYTLRMERLRIVLFICQILIKYCALIQSFRWKTI